MTDTLYVTNPNPEEFFLALASRIEEGYYADDSVSGYPHMDIVNEVKLTQTEQPSQRHDLSGFKEVHMMSWHNTSFVLDYQDAVLQGFELVSGSVKIGDPYAPHYLTMKRPGEEELLDAEPAVEDSVPVEPETTPEAPVHDDMVDALTEALDILQEDPKEPTEAPTEPTQKRKGGRPPKAKEA